MTKRKLLNQIRLRRRKRTRAKIYGTAEKPRFSVFRSNRYAYIQLINDAKGETLASATSRELHKTKKSKLNLFESLGELIAKKAMEKGIKKAVFDRGKYKYQGRLKTIAEGARKGGLQI